MFESLLHSLLFPSFPEGNIIQTLGSIIILLGFGAFDIWTYVSKHKL